MKYRTVNKWFNRYHSALGKWDKANLGPWCKLSHRDKNSFVRERRKRLHLPAEYEQFRNIIMIQNTIGYMRKHFKPKYKKYNKMRLQRRSQ